MTDDGVRVNLDDDVFFFNPDAIVARGQRIVIEGKNFDVLKVKKMSDSKGVHHLEATARATDNK